MPNKKERSINISEFENRAITFSLTLPLLLIQGLV
jgi:hypothetical protein